ncbi:hypothetical protein ACM9W9_01650 [Xanthomonas sacchari]
MALLFDASILAGVFAGGDTNEATIFNFRHLLEKHGFAAKLLKAVNRVLQAKNCCCGIE